MLKYLLLCISLRIVSINSNQINRLRRQSPFADGIQPSLHRYEPRRILSTNAHRKLESNYMIVGPKLVRPSDIVSVWVTILNDQWTSTNVAVSLFNQNDEIASNEERLIPQIPTAIIFQVPQNAPNGSYTIYVRGTLPDGDVVFYNETNVIFHAKSLSIFIQLEKPMYRHDQLVRFRCIPVYSDLRGYFSTVNVYVIGPMNNILRRWLNLQTTWGYVELEYKFASFIAFGTYKIRCEAQQSAAEKTFLVDFFLQKKIEVNVSLPFFINMESPTINGIVTAKYAYYRRASAYMALGKYTLALSDYEYVTKACPNDKDATMKYEECKKIVTRIRFEKAIAVDESTKSVANQIEINTMTIEKEYDGPHLESDGRVTKEFMFALLPYFENQKKLHKRYAYQIILQILTLLKSLPSLIEITVPAKHKFTICGDVHGQFYDLLNIFKLNGPPSEENPYLFNGDFVDRGSFSIECILTLFGFKLLYPNHFFLARGNHESLTMNQMYGFEGEVKAKYTTQMFQLFTEVFNYLPLSHCINNKVLVMHGGLFSKDDVTLKDIRAVDRVKQPPEEGLMSELLWSDPQPQIGRSESKRGVGLQFGPDVTERFLKLNNLEYIVRSHEVKQEGYELAHNGKCITVFSAPNYCDTMGNKGAYITITGDDVKPKFTSYTAVPHPAVRPMMYANQLSMFGLM
ncbi:unnamed protein product [Rotaria sp. Silwood1]|nr:unnamed protein product [Rotaria sp. Silwood1]